MAAVAEAIAGEAGDPNEEVQPIVPTVQVTDGQLDVPAQRQRPRGGHSCRYNDGTQPSAGRNK